MMNDVAAEANSRARDASASAGTPAREGPEPPFVLALDIGTSGVRAALYDSHAQEIEGTQTRLERAFCTTADGGAEADAEKSVNEVVRVIDAMLVRSHGRLVSQIECIALSCFWHSLVGVDRGGSAVTPVFGWADTRAARQADSLRHELDERATHARTGCRLHASYWPAKLRWVQREHPAAWHSAARWMSFSDFLMLRLCDLGRAAAAVATSVSMASGTGLLITHACEWDETLLDALDLSVKRLPRLAQQGETFGLAGEYQKRWPPLRSCTVFPAVGDGAANNIGEGCTTRAQVALMVGTSGAMRAVFEGAPPGELHRGLWCYRVDRHRLVIGGALSDGGGLSEWLRRSLALDELSAGAAAARGEEIEEALAGLAPDAHGLTVLPFWAGERSTGWHADASGAILGLTMHTRPVEILRAAMEAVAYRFALISEALADYVPGAEVRASGRALLASRVWTQVLSDVLGRPITLSRVGEASSRGAVLLALEAQGKIKRVSDISTPTGGACEPDAARHAVYRRGLARQQELYELLVGDQRHARTLDPRREASE